MVKLVFDKNTTVLLQSKNAELSKYLKEISMSIKLKKFDLETKQGKLFKALVLDGQTLSEAQIEHRFGIKNATATISVIRQRGYAIYANQRTAGNGVQVTEYVHGEASRKLIAAGYKAIAMGLAD
jgi:Holliday junction resolvasome RuvABC endonuclease subunit